ncbi:MAG TPA: hypothetical protein VGF67_21950 [Ktedonobacteraceae bacterium]|jgi:hypothetical protein
MVTHDQLTPEEAQEQNRLLVQDLGRYYDTRLEDNASLARIRERLLQKTETSLPTADTGKLQTGVQTRREGDTRMEFGHPSAADKKRHLYLTTLAAAVLVVVLLGSFALVLQRQGTKSGSGQPEAPPISSTLSSCASHPLPVLVDLCTHHQLTDLLQSRRMGMYVVVLERAYLDMNQLLITYRIFSQASGRQTPAAMIDALVTTPEGLSFRQSGGEGVTGPEVVQFSTLALPADTHALQFQVEVRALRLQLLHLPPAGTPLPQPSVVHGSATFDFTLFYHEGLVVAPHQTVSIRGSSVTLGRVLISPSETIVEGMTKGKISNSADYTFLLDAAGRNSSPASSSFGGDGNPFSIKFNDGLLGQHGTWRFEIHAASAPEGLWVFQFRVP